MKKVSIIVVSLLITASISMAQAQADFRAQKTPEKRAEFLTQRIVEKLTLDQAQAKKMEEVHLAQAKKMDELKAKYAETRNEFRQEVKSVHSATEEQYKTILTPEQYQKYLQLKEDRKSNRKAMNKNGRGKK